MSQTVVISVAGVRIALAEEVVPGHLRGSRVAARAIDLSVHVRQGRPLASPHPATFHDAHGLEVSSQAGRFHLVNRCRREGRVSRSAVFDTRGRSVEVTQEGPEGALDRGLLEWLAMHHLAHRGGFVVHGCAVLLERRALLFAGSPGSGRGTVADLLGRVRGLRVVSEHRVAVYPSRGRGYVVAAWPWPEDQRTWKRATGSLQACHRVHTAPFVLAEPLSGNAARHALEQVALLPSGDASGCDAVRSSIVRCSEAVPTIRLGVPSDGRLASYVGGPAVVPRRRTEGHAQQVRA